MFHTWLLTYAFLIAKSPPRPDWLIGVTMQITAAMRGIDLTLRGTCKSLRPTNEQFE